MAAISDNLLHFLGRKFKDSPNRQFEIFKKIIFDGLMCSKINVKFSGGGIVQNNAICFTDIPLSECDEHAATYGKFGIGFKKSYVKNKGGNPARYFIDYLPSEINDNDISFLENRGVLYANLSRHLSFVLLVGEKLKNEPDFSFYDKNGNIVIHGSRLKEWYELQITLLSYDKETGDLGPARDETKDIDLYYKEREWRLVPTILNAKSNTIKIESGKTYYTFSREDVNVIVTPNDEIRSEVLHFFLSLEEHQEGRLKAFAENPVPIVTYDDLKKW